MLAHAGNRYKKTFSVFDNMQSVSRNPMTRIHMLLRNWLVALCGTAALIICGTALADPPGRVARLAHITGAVSFSPAGEDEWVLAQTNRPLITGDRLWSDAGSRAELQIGTAAARLGSNTSATLLNLDDRVVQIEITQGSLNLRVRRVYSDQGFEIDTPNLAFSIRRAGDYRIDVDPNGNSTVVRVRSGEGEAWGENAGYVIGGGQQYTFVGEGLRDYRFDRLAGPDEFDSWCFERNRREDNAVAARYVAPDMVGYSDLDDYGTWRNVEGYGNVWFPTSVGADWVPYRTGHWAWIDPWGWTWIDDAPWGFAPFHYGRWAFVSSRWCWVPGPVAVRPIYAPALVAFIGGGGFSLSVSTGPLQAVAWFPLAPGEVYRPAYTVSRTYFTNVNVTNTVVNTTVVNNVYNNNVTNVVYRNREAPGAVTAVPTTTFTSAQPVARHVVAVPRDVVAREPVAHVVAVAPTQASIAAGAVAAGAAAAAKRPPQAVLERRVVAKTAPPPPPPAFAARASALAAQPGKPLEPEKMKAMPPARAAEAQKQKVKVVAPTVTPQPITKEAGKAGPGARAGAPSPTPPGATAAPQPPQERAMREGKGGPPPAAAAPQPPGQERAMREGKGGPPPAATAPQPPGQERAMREGKGGPPPAAAAPQPPPQEQARERRGPPPGAAAPVPQPPPQEQARERRGPPPGAAAPAPQPAPQEQARERRGPPPGAAAPAPQPPPQEQARERRGPPPGAGAPPPAAPPAPPPQQQARERPASPQQAAAPPPPQPERAKGPPEGKGREREKEKDRKEGQ
jgi:hypothetical protein